MEQLHSSKMTEQHTVFLKNANLGVASCENHRCLFRKEKANILSGWMVFVFETSCQVGWSLYLRLLVKLDGL